MQSTGLKYGSSDTERLCADEDDVLPDTVVVSVHARRVCIHTRRVCNYIMKLNFKERVQFFEAFELPPPPHKEAETSKLPISHVN